MVLSIDNPTLTAAIKATPMLMGTPSHPKVPNTAPIGSKLGTRANRA